jgi:hypothetical protein
VEGRGEMPGIMPEHTPTSVSQDRDDLHEIWATETLDWGRIKGMYAGPSFCVAEYVRDSDSDSGRFRRTESFTFLGHPACDFPSACKPGDSG